MALSDNIGSNLQAKFGHIQAFKAGAGIYRGATVVQKLTTGDVYKAETDDDDSERYLVVGFAMEQVEGGDTIRVRMDGKLKRKWIGPSPVCGRLACVHDDEYVKEAVQGGIVVGRITEITSTGVFVNLEDRPVRIATGEFD